MPNRRTLDEKKQISLGQISGFSDRPKVAPASPYLFCKLSCQPPGRAKKPPKKPGLWRNNLFQALKRNHILWEFCPIISCCSWVKPWVAPPSQRNRRNLARNSYFNNLERNYILNWKSIIKINIEMNNIGKVKSIMLFWELWPKLDWSNAPTATLKFKSLKLFCAHFGLSFFLGSFLIPLILGRKKSLSHYRRKRKFFFGFSCLVGKGTWSRPAKCKKRAGYKLKRQIGIQSWIQTNDQPLEKVG